MPLKAKITKEMILNTALDITREAGFESVSARSASGRLQYSTRSIFTCYENVGELKREFLDHAYKFYSQYVKDFSGFENINPCLVLPVSYTEFTREGTHLLRLLLINHMELSMEEPKNFYKEADSEKKEKTFSDVVGVEPELAEAIFTDLFLYSHGITTLTTTQKITLDRNRIKKMATNMLTTPVRREKPDWTLSP